MLRLTHRARGRVAATVVILSGVLLPACTNNLKDELLSPQQPGVIDPSAVANLTAADALYTGALGRWKNSMNGNGNNTESIWNWEALFTDEVRSADTFSQRNDADQRNLQTNDGVLTPIYQNAQQARGRARDAIVGLLAFDTTPTGKQHTGEMYLQMGYIEMELSQAFCNGIPFGETVGGVPQYTAPLTDADGSKLAGVHLDSALVYLTGTDAGTQNIRNAVLVAKARTQVDLGDFAGAAATVASVPTSFQYNFDYSQTTFDNEWWIMGASVKRYNPGDSIDVAGPILNAIPFARLNDPRVSVTDTKTKAEDNTTNFLLVNNWGRDDPIPLASGIDARLIEAEAKLQAKDIAGMMTILNALRTSPQVIGAFKIAAMTALPTPADQTSATDLFFREKALWQFQRGFRMDDLRRLVRQYGRTQDKVFPTGNFTRNGVPSGQFGTQVAFPVPDNEKSNPNFTGCIDQKA
jgi:starch-binding outer membrane protein, SusD/RagB family